MKKHEVLDFYFADALREEIERGYVLGPRVLGARAATGEAYQQLCGFGGEDGARAAFAQYAKGKKGKLYWRVPPEIEIKMGRFYMRLLISDKKEQVDVAPAR